VKKGAATFILIGIIAFHSINNFIWLSCDNRIPFDDNAFHLIGILQAAALLSHPSLDIFRQLQDFLVADFYPPLFHLWAALCNMVFGKSIIVSHMANIPFIALFMFSVYRIGRQVGGKEAGLLSAFILSMYPYIFGLSRMSLPDYAMMAVMALGIWSLLSSKCFSRLGPSLCLGLSLGIGALIKQLTPIMIAPAILYVCWETFRLYGVKDRRRIVHMVGAFLLAFVIAWPWYMRHFIFLMDSYVDVAFVMGKHYGPPDIFSHTNHM